MPASTPCRFICTLLGALLGLSLATVAAAQAYPTKPIKVINPWPPGGPADVAARPIMQKLEKALGQPVVIESRAGANGMIGTAAVAKAPADGYTLLFSHVGPTAISPAMQREMPYDPVKDFEPITLVSTSTIVLVVQPELPIKSVSELIAHARSNPGKLSYASVGQGSTTHLAGEMLRMMTNVDILHVPYKGAAPVVTDLLGGRVSMAFIGASAVIPHVQAGKLRAIAVTTLKRSALVPELPTVNETLPGFEVNSWYGLMAPAGTPREIVNRLYSEVAKALKSPDIAEHLQKNGLDADGMPPEQYAAKIRSDIDLWARVVKAAGIPPQ